MVSSCQRPLTSTLVRRSRQRADRVLSVYSEQFEKLLSSIWISLAGPPRKHWSDYVRGVAAILRGGRVSAKGRQPTH